MSHWQALAVKISSSSFRLPPQCSCTFTCRRGACLLQAPFSGHLRSLPPLSPQPPVSRCRAQPPHLPQAADGTALRHRGDVMSITTGHQHGVPGREGTGLAVAHTGLCHMGALAGALAVTSHRHVEG